MIRAFFRRRRIERIERRLCALRVQARELNPYRATSSYYADKYILTMMTIAVLEHDRDNLMRKLQEDPN